MVPAVTYRRERDLASDTFKNSVSKTVSSFVKATVIFVGFAVLLRREGWCGDGLWEKEQLIGSQQKQ